MDTAFWGVEVKAGEPVKVQPELGSVIHISQAALGESKKGNETFLLFVKVGEQKLALGTLSTENIPHLSFDLMFEKEFELSHNWKNGSVFFLGYQTHLPDEEDFFVGATDSPGYTDSEEEDLPLGTVETVKPVTIKPKNAKTEKPKATLVEPSKDNETDEDDSDEDGESDEDAESDDDDESEEGMSVDGEDSDDDEDESDSEDEETPKVESGKKRPNDSAAKTPVPSKKAKATTPQKTDGKKAGQVTPHPAKNAGKATANGSNVKSQKSGGQFSCKSCDRSFGSDGALKSHSQAKHGGK